MSSYIDQLNISVRTYNAVKRFGIDTIEELEERIDEFSKHSPNCGKEARAMLEVWRMNNPKEVNEIMSKSDQPVTNVVTIDDKYDKAFNLNTKICFHAQMTQQNLYELCKGLKEMRDGKLYKELGYNNFEEYCEKEVGIKRHQAMKYAAIAELKNVESTQHFGTEKLFLLSKLDETQREEVQKTVNVEDVSVRELKDKISALTKQKDKLLDKAKKDDEQIKSLQSSNAILQGNITDSTTENSMLKTENEKLSEDLDEAMDTIVDLEKQIKELENRPRESYEDTTKIEELTKKLLLAEGKLAQAEKNQGTGNVKSAADTEAVFKAYMAAVITSLNHVSRFLESHRNDPAKDEFRRMLRETKDKIDGMIKC